MANKTEEIHVLRRQGKISGQPPRMTLEQRWALGLASLGSFMVILDVLVVATALTSIRRHLGASLGDLEWTVNAYTLSFAVLLMTAAAFGDRLGRRRVFAAGLGVFAVSSAACALAPDTSALIAARAVQGVGAAMIMPMALALLNGVFPPARRGWAIGIYGSVTGLAAVLGPVLGGAVTQGLGWPSIFWLNVPIALAAIPLVLGRLTETARPGGTVDVPGLLLVTAAALGFVWGLVRGNSAGWGSAAAAGPLAAGAVATLAFVAWERRATHPMVPVRLFRSPAFSAGNAVIFMLNASLTGAIFLMPQFQQVVLGQDPINAGLRLLPWGIVPFLIAPRAGALADRVGERSLAVTGLLLEAAGMAWIAAVASPGVSYLALVVPMSVIGAGFALAIPAVTRSVTSTVAAADIGTASGAFSTMRQLGGVFGVAILGAAFAATGSYASPEAFSRGFVTASAAAAGIALIGVAAGVILPGREDRRSPAPGSGQGRPVRAGMAPGDATGTRRAVAGTGSHASAGPGSTTGTTDAASGGAQ
ncbi:MAG TPA: MFS transporter [Streptosporangiaceae bacterium]